MPTKKCPKCNSLKDLREFAIQKSRKDGCSSTCKECLRANGTRWRRSNPNKKKETNLKYLYDISLHEYEEILKKQNGKCAICNKNAAENLRGKLFVDHSHETGKVRGLLCHQCNDGLGKFKDNVELLLKAIEYLRKQ